MMKVIGQETFNDVVFENINDFEMSPEEALNDAIEQFQSQGVNLNNVIREIPDEDKKHKVEKYLSSLNQALENGNITGENFENILSELTTELKSDLAKRYQVCKNRNATSIVFKALTTAKTKQTLECFAALVLDQPDEVKIEHMKYLQEFLEETNENKIIETLVKLLKNACLKHEGNRQQFVKMKMIALTLDLAETHASDLQIVQQCCGFLRCLTLDDDIRVPHGQAHEHAKMIASEHSGLERLTKIAQDNSSDVVLLTEICSTLSKLLVRSEFCQQLVDIGGLTLLCSLLNEHIEYKPIVKACVILLKTLSGNDEVKVSAVKNGAVDMLLQIIRMHPDDAQLCRESFAALTMLSLWNATHSNIIMEKKAAPIIAEVMRLHPDRPQVLKQGCILIRSLVARTRQHSVAFIEQDIESLIRDCRKQHKTDLDDEAKAALRDLDLEVDLKEQWLGQNKQMSA